MRLLPILTLSILALLLVVSSSTAILPFRASAATTTITKHVDLGFTSNIPISFSNGGGDSCDFAIFACVFSHYLSFNGNAYLKVDLGVDVSMTYDPSQVVAGKTLPVTITYTPTPGGSYAEFDISGDLTLSFSGCVSCPTNAPFTLTSGSATFTAPMGTDSPVTIPGTGSSLDVSDLITATVDTSLDLGPVGGGLYPGFGGGAAFIQASGATIIGAMGNTVPPFPPVTEWDQSGITQTVDLQLPSTLNTIELSLSPLVHWLQTSGSVSMALHWGKVADDIYSALRTSACLSTGFPAFIFCFSHTSSTPPDPSPISIFSGSLGQFYTQAHLDSEIGSAVTAATGQTAAGALVSENIANGILPIPLLSPPLAAIVPGGTLPNLGTVNFFIYAGLGALQFESTSNVLVSFIGSSGGEQQAGCLPSGGSTGSGVSGCGTGQVSVNIPDPTPEGYSLTFSPPTGGPVQLSGKTSDAAGNVLDTFTTTSGPGSSPQITLTAAGDLYIPYVAPIALATSQNIPSLSGTEGTPLASQTVAAFSDTDGNTDPTQYSTTINWGDGIASAGLITFDTGTGQFVVAGGHTYADEGTFPVNVEITDADGSIGSSTITANIAGGTLSGSPVSIVANAGIPTGGAVATFTDGSNTPAPASDYTASISWGDTSPASEGTISSDSSGTLTVYGDHTYSTAGPVTVAVTISEDDGSSSITESQTLTVQAAVCGPSSPTQSIPGEAISAQDSCTWGTTPSGGPQVYSPDTGIGVSVTGATGTLPSPITLSDINGNPSQGADINLNAPSYYDVNLGGITDGTAQVCISSSTNTLMEYWGGSSWVPASSVQQFSSLFGFDSVCGNIPGSGLTGTSIAIGTPASTPSVPDLPFGSLSIIIAAIVAVAVYALLRLASMKRFPRYNSF
jgi:hypothetical protein